MSNSILRTHEWFVASGQMPSTPKADARQTAFYLGMQLEELSEKLKVLDGLLDLAGLIDRLDSEADRLKAGTCDEAVGLCLAHPEAAESLLDADMDLLWVSIGAAYASGCDAAGAYNEVARANWDKFPGGIVTRDIVTGKVVKPAGWRAPNLKPFLPSGAV